MAVAIASDLGKDIAGSPLFRGVSFKLERRERLTLAGRNGAGKTTLLRMLSGETSVDSGQLTFQKGVRIALHDQRPPREDGTSLRDYVLAGCAELISLEETLTRLELKMAEGDMDVFDAYSRAQSQLEHAGGYNWREGVNATLHGLGFKDADLDRDLATFSGGELTRASLARALSGDPDLILLDEPTNHLDIESLEWLENYLQNVDAAVVLVAHDRWFLEAVGTAVLELEAGRSRFFAGTWYRWRKEKAQRELALGRAIDKQEAEIAKLQRFVDRFSAGTRAKQAQSRAKKLGKIEKLSHDPRDTRDMGFAFKTPERAGRVIFELEDAQVTIGDQGRVLLDDAEFWLERGEHVSLVGMNGTGKSTLLKVLTGDHEMARGKIRRGHNVTLGLLSQHAEVVGETGSVIEACVRATRLKPNEARSLLGRFLFSGEAAEKPVAGLSGGERQRLSLACLVAGGANVLVLDEPTNHLDLESREALESALQDFPGSVLLVSHDRALLDAVGTRTVAVEDGTLRSYVGGWPEYVRVREERRNAPKVAKAVKAQSKPAAAPAARKPNPAKVKTLEAEIERAEAELARLESELADPQAWNDPRSAEKSTRKHAQARTRLDELYAQWEAVA